MLLLQHPAISLINLYQNYLSPIKGYRCAYAVLHQAPSCSHAVKAIIQEHGYWLGRKLIKNRFKACKQSYYVLRNEAAPSSLRFREKSCLSKAAESCSCDPCQLIPIRSTSCDLGDCGCDIGFC